MHNVMPNCSSVCYYVLHCTHLSLDENLYEFNRCVFILTEKQHTDVISINTNTAHYSNLNILCSRLRQLRAEPWRVVEFTAGAGTSAAMAVPQWVVVIEDYASGSVCSTFTKIIIVYEGRCVNCSVGSARAGVSDSRVLSCYKCPNMVSWILPIRD